MRLHRLTTVLTGVALALVGCSDDPGTPEASGPASAAAASPSASPVQPLEAECKPYPTQLATGLVTDKTTGKTRVPGPVGKAVAVKSGNPRPDGKATYVIAIDVGGKVAVLSHVVGPQDGPEAPGPFSAVNPFSVRATGIKTDRSAQIGVKQAVELARGCVR